MNDPKPPRSGLIGYLVVIVVVAGATVGVISLLDNVSTRKLEGEQVAFPLAEIDETTIDAAVWGKTFPRQYDSYLRTVDMVRTAHGGNEAVQKLDEKPVWRELWAGYAFSVDYREKRGHAYMLADQRNTERVKVVNQPGACLHCHASNVVAYRKVGLEKGATGKLTDPLLSKSGQEQLEKGFAAICAMPFDDATKLVSHPVTCLDCHDPKSMKLRITRSAAMDGLANLAKSDDPVPHLPSIERWRKGNKATPYDANTMASRHEMRTLVCSQCHVEYYFAPDTKRVVFPWHNGLKAEQSEAYYASIGFADWTHKTTKAKMLKAQHPEFELWSQGTHARAGVSCADCHMPYTRQGAIKVTDHQTRSPMLNLARACQTCHRVSETELMARVDGIQDRTKALIKRAEDAALANVNAIKAAMASGVGDQKLEKARKLHRKAQWRLDFVASENSKGFHAAQEAARILGEAIDYARQGELAAIKAKLTP